MAKTNVTINLSVRLKFWVKPLLAFAMLAVGVVFHVFSERHALAMMQKITEFVFDHGVRVMATEADSKV